MLKKIFYFLVVIAFLAFLVFLSTQNNIPKNSFDNNTNYIKIADKFIKVELAISDFQQKLGLSNRTSLEIDSGMLFIFEKIEPHHFWMKDMNFPIDIIWIDENFKIIFIEENVSPESYPKTFGPAEASKYVLEVRAGFSEENGLEKNQKLKFYFQKPL